MSEYAQYITEYEIDASSKDAVKAYMRKSLAEWPGTEYAGFGTGIAQWRIESFIEGSDISLPELDLISLIEYRAGLDFTRWDNPGKVVVLTEQSLREIIEERDQDLMRDDD